MNINYMVKTDYHNCVTFYTGKWEYQFLEHVICDNDWAMAIFPSLVVGFQGSRIKFVVVGKLGPMESFGEVSILLDQPSPCSIVTATEVQVGIIQPDALKG